MDLLDFQETCLALPAAVETLPFGPDVVVYKVAGKIFGLASLTDLPTRINLKCDPERSLELRDRYASILPGYHMSKKHWNTLILDGSLPSKLIRELVQHSYDLVVPKPRAKA
jgi:predicted DNA-binding protein (MmcQ/YjbR family)